jgi:hypothetical protein
MGFGRKAPWHYRTSVFQLELMPKAALRQCYKQARREEKDEKSGSLLNYSGQQV